VRKDPGNFPQPLEGNFTAAVQKNLPVPIIRITVSGLSFSIKSIQLTTVSIHQDSWCFYD
jgi:hypothetical protein